jgi:hypothetical protein
MLREAKGPESSGNSGLVFFLSRAERHGHGLRDGGETLEQDSVHHGLLEHGLCENLLISSTPEPNQSFGL